MTRHCRVLVGLVGLIGFGCGPSPAPAAPAAATPQPSAGSEALAPAATASEDLPELWSGTVPAEVLEPVEAVALERGVLGDSEVFLLALPAGWRPRLNSSTGASGTVDGSCWVSVAGENQLSGVYQPAPAAHPEADQVWLRRRANSTPTALSAALYCSEADWGERNGRGVTIPLSVQLTPELKAKPGLERRFTAAVAGLIAERKGLPFRDFASERLRPAATTGAPRSNDQWRREAEWPELMEIFSGERSVEAALQTRAQLRTAADQFRPQLALSQLRPPAVVRHPWEKMLQALGNAVPSEPLAKLIPADFYYVRANDIGALFELIDQVDAWGTPAMHLFKGQGVRADMVERYRTQLGLSGSELSKLLGPELIEQLALTGSDPFLRQGSDVTLIFKPRNAELLLAGLERDVVRTAAPHGTLSHSPAVTEGAATLTHKTTANGRVNRWMSVYKEWVILSNSQNALRRVIQVVDGKVPALSEEPDFRYMLARDPHEAEQVLAYAGDRFIESIVSPRSRVLDARRQIALAELHRPGFAALLHGWVYGRVPASQQELLKSQLLTSEDQRHFDKQPIAFTPGSAPRSAWGSPRSLVPLIDLPDLTKVTQAEKQAYESFVARYEQLWATALDPIAFRLHGRKQGRKHSISAKLRVLPLVRDADYSQVVELVGNQRVGLGHPPGGARFVFAIAEDSELRRELTRSSHGILGRELKLDWLGTWGMVGVLDHPDLAVAMHRAGLAPEPQQASREHRDEFTALTGSPAYAALGINNKAAALLVITVLKSQFGEGLAAFRSHSKHGETSITEVNIENEVKFYYALTKTALFVAFNPVVLHTLLDLDVRGKMPQGSRSVSGPGQFAFDMHASEGGALRQVLSWAFERQAREGSAEGVAEMLLLGAPDVVAAQASYDELSLEYLGRIPMTQDGKSFELRASGVADPVRGNQHEWTWPKLPVPGSPVPRVLAALGHLTSQLGFDDEPTLPDAEPQRSLVLGVEIQGR